MQSLLADQFQRRLPQRNASEPQYVSELVEVILHAARHANASDVHLIPAAKCLEMRWRIDGVLQHVAQFPAELGPRVVTRLKVLSELLTYHTEVPQEGRIRVPAGHVETRISTFPTLFGEKVVIRLFAEPGEYQSLDSLGFSDSIRDDLKRLLGKTSGAILVTGPAGSGKTTTIYACLRELVDKFAAGKSLVSLEDPIEVIVQGVTQSQVNCSAGFDLPTGLRSLMRQDPEVIMVGEIRDRGVAEIVFQASLTGHLVLTTFHAGSAADAISRLCDMGIEPYLLRSGVLGVFSQRLVRKLCSCSEPGSSDDDKFGLPVESVRRPVGCDDCRGTGYRGRIVLAEMLIPQDDQTRRAILSRADSGRLQELAVDAGMVTCRQHACRAINEGLTSPAEVRRTLGF